MQAEQLLDPSIRVAHSYRFPAERNAAESGRVGYCYAFHLVCGGKGEAVVSGSRFPLGKGDLLYIPPRTLHSFCTDSDHPLYTYNVYCELWGGFSLKPSAHLVWDEADFDRSMLTNIVSGTDVDKLPYKLSLQSRTLLLDLFARIVAQHQGDKPFSVGIANSLLKALVLELLQLLRQPHSAMIDPRIKSIIASMDSHPDRSEGYERWLASSGLKKTQFHELFKQAAGVSPKTYRTRSVMSQAAAALLESMRSVTDIAEDFGYSSIHHFSKQFKAFYGVSPAEYRKRNGNWA